MLSTANTMTATANTMHPTTKRIEWLDISKGIAIILVVLGHTLSSANPLWSIIYSFHMPLFFFVAGYTFRTKPLPELSKSSTLRLLLPYCVCFLLISISALLMQQNLPSDWLLKQAYGFFFASAIQVKFFDLPAVGIIWFFWALFASRIWLNIAITAFDKYQSPEWLRFAFFFALSIIGGLIGNYLFLPLALDLITATSFFMYLGYLAKQKQVFSKVKVNLIACSAALVLWLLCLIYTPYFMDNFFHTRLYGNPLAALSGTLVCIYASMILVHIPGVKQYLVFMGANSIVVFFLHGIGGQLIDWSGFAFLTALPANVSPTVVIFACRMLVISLFMWLLLLNPIVRQHKLKSGEVQRTASSIFKQKG